MRSVYAASLAVVVHTAGVFGQASLAAEGAAPPARWRRERQQRLFFRGSCPRVVVHAFVVLFTANIGTLLFACRTTDGLRQPWLGSILGLRLVHLRAR